MPLPESLSAVLADVFDLRYEQYQFLWFLPYRLVLFRSTPWVEGDTYYAAAAISLLRVDEPPEWVVEELGVHVRCTG